MHLYGLVRAEKDRLQKWINDLSAQFYPIKWIDPTTQKVVGGYVQLAVREVKLLEIVFPAESEAEVMTMLNPHGQVGGFTKILKKIYFFLGLNKVLPREKWAKTNKLVANDNIEFIAIGTKPDLLIPSINVTPTAQEQL